MSICICFYATCINVVFGNVVAVHVDISVIIVNIGFDLDNIMASPPTSSSTTSTSSCCPAWSLSS